MSFVKFTVQNLDVDDDLDLESFGRTLKPIESASFTVKRSRIQPDMLEELKFLKLLGRISLSIEDVDELSTDLAVLNDTIDKAGLSLKEVVSQIDQTSGFTLFVGEDDRVVPQVIASNTPTVVENSAQSILDSFSPEGMDSDEIYDGIEDLINVSKVGTTWLLRVSMDARCLVADRQVICRLYMAPGTPQEQIISVSKVQHTDGANVWENLTFLFSIYQLGIFLANGGELRIFAEDTQLEITNVVYFFSLTHKVLQ